MPITLELAEKQLEKWIEAEMQLTHVGSYTIGDRTLNYRNIKEVRDSIDYWQSKVNNLKHGNGIRAYRGIPIY